MQPEVEFAAHEVFAIVDGKLEIRVDIFHFRNARNIRQILNGDQMQPVGAVRFDAIVFLVFIRRVAVQAVSSRFRIDDKFLGIVFQNVIVALFGFLSRIRKPEFRAPLPQPPHAHRVFGYGIHVSEIVGDVSEIFDGNLAQNADAVFHVTIEDDLFPLQFRRFARIAEVVAATAPTNCTSP